MFRFTIRDVLWLMAFVAHGLGWWVDHRRASLSLAYFKERLSSTERIKDENMVKYHFLWRSLDEKQKAAFSKQIGQQGFVSKGNQPTSQSP
jgi:hypothetical protein